MVYETNDGDRTGISGIAGPAPITYARDVTVHVSTSGSHVAPSH